MRDALAPPSRRRRGPCIAPRADHVDLVRQRLSGPLGAPVATIFDDDASDAQRELVAELDAAVLETSVNTSQPARLQSNVAS